MNDAEQDGINPLAVALSGMPEVWQRLIDEHVPDSYGRCAACRNSSTPGVPWPCTLQVVAEDARALFFAGSPAPDPAPCDLAS